MTASKQGPEGTRFAKGTSGNPGGLTTEERAARDAMRQALAEPGIRKKGLAAYKRLLDADNPLIVRDFMDRIAGKVKERVSVEDEEGNSINPLAGATLAQILEIVRSGK